MLIKFPVHPPVSKQQQKRKLFQSRNVFHNEIIAYCLQFEHLSSPQHKYNIFCAAAIIILFCLAALNIASRSIISIRFLADFLFHHFINTPSRHYPTFMTPCIFYFIAVTNNLSSPTLGSLHASQSKKSKDAVYLL